MTEAAKNLLRALAVGLAMAAAAVVLAATVFALHGLSNWIFGPSPSGAQIGGFLLAFLVVYGTGFGLVLKPWKWAGRRG